MDAHDLAQIYQGLLVEQVGAVALTLDGQALQVHWLTAWGDREQLRPYLADPAQGAAYQAQIRRQLRAWIDWGDATTTLLEGWGGRAQCGPGLAVLTQWRAQWLTLLADLEAWDPAAPLLPAFGWCLGPPGDDDGEV